MDALVGVNSAEEDQLPAAHFLERIQREIDAVVNGGQVIQSRRAIGVADRDKISVAIFLDRPA